MPAYHCENPAMITSPGGNPHASTCPPSSTAEASVSTGAFSLGACSLFEGASSVHRCALPISAISASQTQPSFDAKREEAVSVRISTPSSRSSNASPSLPPPSGIPFISAASAIWATTRSSQSPRTPLPPQDTASLHVKEVPLAMLPYPASSGTFSTSRPRNISQAAAPEAPSGSSPNTAQSYPEIEHENPHHNRDRRRAFADASIRQSRPPGGNVTRAPASPLTSANPDDEPSHDQAWPPFGIDSVDVICDTLGELEQLASELRDMDHVIPPRPPTRRLVRPPPRISSLHALHLERDSYESLPDSRRSSFDSSDGYHSPLLSGRHHLAYLRDDVSSSEDGLRADIPRIVLTVPSSEELFRRHQTPPIEVDLMFAEESMDVMQWLDEYGLWTDSGAEDLSDDSDSDTSSLFVYGSDTSSIHTSPPNSPGIQTPKDSPIKRYFTPTTPKHTRTPALPEEPCSPTTSISSSPSMWLRRMISKPLLNTRKSFASLRSPPASPTRGRLAQCSVDSDNDPFMTTRAPPVPLRPETPTTPTTPTPTLTPSTIGPFSKHPDTSCWSVSTESPSPLVRANDEPRPGWGSLRRLFKKTK